MRQLSLRCPRGQATTEYVGVLTCVAALLVAAAFLVPGAGIAGSVADGFRRALCFVTGSSCRPAEPCVVASSVRRERVKALLFLPQGEWGQAIRVEEFSDGHVEVSFSGSGKAGAGVGIGIGASAGASKAGGQADAAVGVQFTSGTMWSFRDRAEAQRFLDRYAQDETLAGKAGGLASKVCARCVRWVGGRAPLELPAAAVEWRDATMTMDGIAGGGLGETLEGGAAVDLLHGIGTKIDRRTGSGSVYYRLEAKHGFALATLIGDLPLVAGHEVVLEVVQAPSGRPLALRFVGAARASAGVAKPLPEADRRKVAPSASAARADVLEIEARGSLDLTDAGNLAVWRALTSTRDPRDFPGRAAALVRRFRDHGRITVGRYAAMESEHGASAEGGLLFRVGGGYRVTSGERSLVDVSVRDRTRDAGLVEDSCAQRAA